MKGALVKTKKLPLVRKSIIGNIIDLMGNLSHKVKAQCRLKFLMVHNILSWGKYLDRHRGYYIVIGQRVWLHFS